MTITPAHLGGHDNRAHTDRATLEYLINQIGDKAPNGSIWDKVITMLDVGCGPGHNVRLAQSMGVAAFGIEGDPAMAGQAGVNFIHDYTTGPFEWRPNWVKPIDIAWCFEVYEHVPAEHSPNLWDTFSHARVLFLTVAPRGFGGWHHVNELDEWEVRALLTANDWAIDEGATSWVRENGDHNFTRQRGIVARNNRHPSAPSSL